MNEFYYIARLRIKRKDDKGNEYFGRGVADLLHGVDEFCSLNLAARHRMRKSGSTLTVEGRKMLEAYEEAERAAWAAADAVMERYYGDGKNGEDKKGAVPEPGDPGNGF